MPSNSAVPPTSKPVAQKKILKAKHRIGYDEKWAETRPWLFTRMEDDGTFVIYCKLCRKHKTKGMNGSITWNEKGCAILRLDKVVDHEKSEMHKTALRIETSEQMNIAAAFEEKTKLGHEEFQALKCATKILHFLIRHNIPHNTIFKDLVNFATDELQCPDLQFLKKGQNAKYTSTTFVNELITSMSEDIEETLKEKISKSPGYALMNDETTDVSNKKHLAFCVKYLDSDTKNTCVNFVKDVPVSDGKAETIFNETKTVIEDLGVDTFVGFSSDGCNTMVGKKTGVSTRLKEYKPEIVTLHCHNHRLALAAKDSFESIKIMRDTDDLLTSIFKYYKNSSNRSSSLENIQKLLQVPQRKIKQSGHTRWLSHLEAVTSLRDTYQAVLVDLENAVESGLDKVRLGSGPSASGLLKKLKSYEHVHIVHFLCDALKPVTNLALTFEKNNVDLSTVKPRKDSAISALQKLKSAEGPSTRRVSKVLIENQITPNAQQIEVVRSVECQFLDNLVEAIEVRFESSDIIDQMSVFSMVDCSTFFGNDEVMCLAEHFSLDQDICLEEWDSVKNVVSDLEEGVVNGPCDLLKVFHKLEETTGNLCPNLEKICAAAAVLPISTAEVERVFSELNLVKTDLRNRLHVEKVHQLLMIHRNEQFIDYGRAVQKWHSMKKRRI